MTAATHPDKQAKQASEPKKLPAGGSGTWTSRLFTHEDPQNVHKTLGGLCLLSYAFRLAQVGAADMGFASHPEWTLPTIALHFLLNASSFVFHIPAVRIKTGYRIWPEYRLHSLVFLCRSLLFIGLVYLEQVHALPSSYRHDLNLLVVLGTMAAADLSSNAQGKYRSSTIRGFDTPPLAKYFFSFMQLCATGGCVLGIRRCSTQFIYVIIVQLNAFLMTLRRKNLASHHFLLFLYGVMLTVGYLVCDMDHRFYGGGPYVWMASMCIGFTATLLRVGPRLPVLSYIQNNKYLLWASIGLIVRQCRPFFEADTSETATFLAAYLGLVTLGVVGLGLSKHLKGNRRNGTAAHKKQ
mmetsp:Transcript_12907/g.24651  ORF Transcript_12907/g.24651 Transcript_12907/m.24651 type:complete len:352 (-) Transcript_12907:260-1315(-)